MSVQPLPRLLVEPIVAAALREDLGRAGDLTTDATVPAELHGSGGIVARAAGRVAGLDAAALAFVLLDPMVAVRAHVAAGEAVAPGARLATVEGTVRALLTAERTALNFLGHLSGIATATAQIVEVVASHGVAVADTRKTTPGLRALEKHAVRAGGGANHRFGLDDAVLVKDNHVAAAGGVGEAVRRARSFVGHLVKVQAEVDSLAQIDEALDAGADALLLDNFSPNDLAVAVRRVDERAITEASGTITPETAPAVAASGVDLLSVGWLTHSAPSLDVALDLDA